MPKNKFYYFVLTLNKDYWRIVSSDMSYYQKKQRKILIHFTANQNIFIRSSSSIHFENEQSIWKSNEIIKRCRDFWMNQSQKIFKFFFVCAKIRKNSEDKNSAMFYHQIAVKTQMIRVHDREIPQGNLQTIVEYRIVANRTVYWKLAQLISVTSFLNFCK